MPFPKTDTEAIAQGYKFEKKGHCRGANCKAEIEWWITPKGKQMPFDPGTMEPHWSTCPDRDRFKTH